MNSLNFSYDYEINLLNSLIIPYKSGVYVIKANSIPIYVGQSSVLNQRFKDYEVKNTTNMGLLSALLSSSCTFSFVETGYLDFYESAVYWSLQEQGVKLVNDPSRIPIGYQKLLGMLGK